MKIDCSNIFYCCPCSRRKSSHRQMDRQLEGRIVDFMSKIDMIKTTKTADPSLKGLKEAAREDRKWLRENIQFLAKKLNLLEEEYVNKVITDSKLAKRVYRYVFTAANSAKTPLPSDEPSEKAQKIKRYAQYYLKKQQAIKKAKQSGKPTSVLLQKSDKVSRCLQTLIQALAKALDISIRDILQNLEFTEDQIKELEPLFSAKKSPLIPVSANKSRIESRSPSPDSSSREESLSPRVLASPPPQRATLCTPEILHPATAGLPNLGNTCFMNSLLHATILHDADYTHLLNQRLTQRPRETRGHFQARVHIQTALKNIKNEIIKSSPNQVVLRENLSILRNNPLIQDMAPGLIQADSAEFFRIVHDAVEGEGEARSRIGLAYASHMSTLDGSHLPKINISGIGSFTYVIPSDCHPIPEAALAFNASSSSLQGCIDAFQIPEILTGSERVDFDGDKKDARKRLYFISLDKDALTIPKKIRLTLPRFYSEYDRTTKRLITRKNTTAVRDCDKPFTIPIYDMKGERILARATFRPDTIVRHSGTLAGGHYTADVRKADGSWLNYNDSCVSPSSRMGLDQEAYIIQASLVHIENFV